MINGAPILYSWRKLTITNVGNIFRGLKANYGNELSVIAVDVSSGYVKSGQSSWSSICYTTKFQTGLQMVARLNQSAIETSIQVANKQLTRNRKYIKGTIFSQYFE